MPWDDASTPNAMVEVTDACNLDCTYCYAPRGQTHRTVGEVERDLDVAARLRRLHTVTISGGEPTLHPELERIVAAVRRRRLVSFLLTNGVLVDRALLARLVAAGLDAVLFHVDSGQRRPDLEGGDDDAARARRVRQLARWAAAEGVDASLAVTLGGDGLTAAAAAVDLLLSCPDLTFLFLARGARQGRAAGGWSVGDVAALLRRRWDLEPFSFIPDQRGDGTVWLSYFVPVARTAAGATRFPFRAGRADSLLLRLPRLLRGRFVHKTRQNAAVTLVRTAVNGLATGRPAALARFVARLARPGARLEHKIVVYDHGPVEAADGRLVRCAYCPTAVVRDGRLVPCCEEGQSGRLACAS